MAKEKLPSFEPVELTLELLKVQGDRLVHEQDMVMQSKLSEEYYRKQSKMRSMIGLSG